MVFLLMVLVILVFAVLWNVDVHKILHLKSRSQNAGDAAALMAARWQGITLNIIGDLNIMQAVAISEDDSFALGAITNIQQRLCYTGPLIALEASQQAAKNNGIYSNELFTARLTEHARAVKYDYPFKADSGGNMLFPEPYANAWDDYSAMLLSVAQNGVATGPDNTHYYTDRAGPHWLLHPGFYYAVAGSSWCWFYHHDFDLLVNYSNYGSWDDLPEIENRYYVNSEVFCLWLKKENTPLESMTPDADAFRSLLNEIASDRSLGTITTNAMETNAVWYCYDMDRWGTWNAMDTEGSDPFPLTGTVKEHYDYVGADAVCRITADALTLLTPDQTAPDVVWTAAAKPFGYLNEDERPNSYSIVLPAFHQVALIPIDASTVQAGGSYDIAWRLHIEKHLEPYVNGGPSRLETSCFYCQQLGSSKWESTAFRNAGVEWLSTNSYLCVLPSTGTHRGSGTSRGH